MGLTFMIGFVFVFDKAHWRKAQAKLWNVELLSAEELNQIQAILSACQDV